MRMLPCGAGASSPGLPDSGCRYMGPRPGRSPDRARRRGRWRFSWRGKSLGGEDAARWGPNGQPVADRRLRPPYRRRDRRLADWRQIRQPSHGDRHRRGRAADVAEETGRRGIGADIQRAVDSPVCRNGKHQHHRRQRQRAAPTAHGFAQVYAHTDILASDGPARLPISTNSAYGGLYARLLTRRHFRSPPARDARAIQSPKVVL